MLALLDAIIKECVHQKWEANSHASRLCGVLLSIHIEDSVYFVSATKIKMLRSPYLVQFNLILIIMDENGCSTQCLDWFLITSAVSLSKKVGRLL